MSVILSILFLLTCIPFIQANITEEATGGQSSLKVGIIGAGISGLYAGLLLQSINVNYEILESNPFRFGGRLYTYRFDEPGQSSKCENLKYIDLGAMRFPRLKTFERLNGNQSWSLFRYLNDHTTLQHQLQILPYVYNHGNNLHYINGYKAYEDNLAIEKDWFGRGQSLGGLLPDQFAVKPYSHLMKTIFGHHFQLLLRDYHFGLHHIKESQDVSARDYLLQVVPPAVIDVLESLAFGPNFFNGALQQMLQVEFATLMGEDWQCIDGGSSRIAEAMVSILTNKPNLGHRVLSIKPNKKGNKLSVKTALGHHSYDHVILTPSFPVLADIDLKSCNLSYAKRLIIDSVDTPGCVKIGFVFTKRWWQDEDFMNGKPIFGGESVTDLPVKSIVFPSQGLECTDYPGVLMVSYACNRDALRLERLSNAQLEKVCMENLKEIYGNNVEQFYTGEYVIQRWSLDQNIRGVYTQFEPGQLNAYEKDLLSSEVNGRLHFAGETVGDHHGWTVGSLKTAYRAVKEILWNEGLVSKLNELVQMWGED